MLLIKLAADVWLYFSQIPIIGGRCREAPIKNIPFSSSVVNA